MKYVYYRTRLNNKSTALNDSIEAIYTKFQLPFNGLNNDDTQIQKAVKYANGKNIELNVRVIK